MIIGLTADTYKIISVSFTLRILKWIGVPFSEVTQNVFSHPKKVLRVSQGMMLGLHLPNVGNFGYDLSFLKRKQEIEFLLREIEQYRNGFHFKYAVFHPPEGDTSQQSFDFYIQNLLKVKIPLFLENPQGWLLDQFSPFFFQVQEKLKDQLHGICMDIPHLYLSGEDWIKFYRILYKKIRIIHLSDCKNNEDLHLPFGLGGDLNLQNILKTLDQEGFDNILNFEINPPSLNHLDCLFKTYLQATEFYHPGKNFKMKYRMKIVSRLGRCAGLLFN